MLHETVLDREALDLLYEYCQLPFLTDFSLSGGTALALRLGHRISYDLDMFNNSKFDIPTLEAELESHYGIDYIKRYNLSNALFTTIKLIKSDFVHDYGNVVLTKETIGQVRIYPIEENIGMKLNAIIGRGRKRDFYDLHFILQQYKLGEVCNFYSAKYDDEKLLILLKSMVYFDDAEDDEDPLLLKKKISWEKVKSSLRKNITAESKQIIAQWQKKRN